MYQSVPRPALQKWNSCQFRFCYFWICIMWIKVLVQNWQRRKKGTHLFDFYQKKWFKIGECVWLLLHYNYNTKLNIIRVDPKDPYYEFQHSALITRSQSSKRPKFLLQVSLFYIIVSQWRMWIDVTNGWQLFPVHKRSLSWNKIPWPFSPPDVFINEITLLNPFLKLMNVHFKMIDYFIN